jgi:hypothetical protein
MTKRFAFGVVAAVLAVMVLGGAVVWATAGGSDRAAALEESLASLDARGGFSWYLYGGTTGQAFWADLQSVAGCDAQGEVGTGGNPATGATGKHISGVSTSQCRLQILVNERAAAALYAWLNETLSETYTRKNLTLVKESNTSNDRMSISLEDVLIERIELPAFQSGSSGQAATIALTVRAEESTRNSNATGVSNPPSVKLSASASTHLFDVVMSDPGSLYASRFEPWGAVVTITRGPTGTQQIPQNQATGLSVGNLGLSISRQTNQAAGRADDLHMWFNTLVVQGNTHPSQERTLTLTLKDPRTSTSPPFLTLTFTNVGIFGEPSYWLGNDPEKFLFYAEGVSFAGHPSAAPPPPPPPPPAAPPAPANLQAVIGEGGAVNLSWDPVKAAAPTYKVLYAPEPGGEYKDLRATTEETTLRVELPAGTYYFVVRAVSGGTESEDSNEVSVEVAG